MQLTIEQFGRLTNPVCSVCEQRVIFDGAAVSHLDTAALAFCELLANGRERKLSADDTPEARAVMAEMAAAG